MDNLLLYIRKEINDNEYRTPLTPKDAEKLINKKYKIYIESSNNRIYKDDEYDKVGCIITKNKWYNNEYNKGIIIGIKELRDLDKLDNHIHVYFSHSYKNQKNSRYILERFKESNSILYDFEFFMDENNKRLIAFGFYAGYVGCCLGILQYFIKKKTKENIKNLKPWRSKIDIINDVKNIYEKNISVSVIGPNGKCGSSICKVLDMLEISYVKYNRNDKKIGLECYDIIYNCILLDTELNETWIDTNTLFKKPITIVDISCDNSKINNPIKLNNQSTSWEEPVITYNSNIDIISIENLPSLLPKESSDDFSIIFYELLLNFHIENNKIWENNKKRYMKIKENV
jgi:saccharopine dehydrogenase (NAD+, L-lysine-forming)